MSAYLRGNLVVVWSILVLATTLSWWLGVGHGSVIGVRAATVAVLVVAFVKAYLVGMHFMELRHAPLPLRLVFGIWSVAVAATLVGLYLII